MSTKIERRTKRPMRVLFIGGTGFISTAVSQLAIAKIL